MDCNMNAQRVGEGRPEFAGLSSRPKLIVWLAISVLAALVTYFGFRGYLNPELLFHFSNSLYC